MTITLSPKTQQLLKDQMEKRNFSSADELIEAALSALDELGEFDQSMLDEIDKAEAEIARGEIVEWEEVRERIRGEFRGERAE